MADDDVEEKKFDPSGRRLQQLRRQGQVAKSQDFVAATSLAVLVIYLMFNFSAFRDAFAAALTLVPMENGTDFLSRAILTLSGVGTLFIQTIGPVFAVAFFGYVAAYAFDAKGIPIATNQLAPNISRVNPVEGVKNLFRKDALVELAKGLVKIALMAIGVWYVFKWRANDLFWSPTCGVSCAWPLALRVIAEAIIVCLIIFLIIAIIDIKISRALFTSRNKMTLTEVKREQKEDTGDPFVRRQRRQIMRESATTPVMRGVARATLVLRGQDDRTVAIAYVQGLTPAPVVVAKGEGVEGRAIVNEGQNRSIPAIAKPELVEALIKRGRVGQAIPQDLFREVAIAMVQSRSV